MSSDAARIDRCLETILALARLEFEHRAEVSGAGDPLDALAAGLNMLGEELASSTTTAAELEKQVAARTAELELRAAALTTLLREVHHRVKNNLQVVLSLLRLYSESSTDPQVRAAFRETGFRVRAMALVHELLYRTEDVGAIDVREYLTALLGELQRGLRGEAPITVALEAPPVRAPMERAVPLGLIVTELVSNAYKHAFPDKRAGQIRVELRPLAAEPATFELLVADDGVGDTRPPPRSTPVPPGVGRDLVRGLARQLQGAVTIAHDGGTKVRVTMKLEAPT